MSGFQEEIYGKNSEECPCMQTFRFVIKPGRMLCTNFRNNVLQCSKWSLDSKQDLNVKLSFCLIVLNTYQHVEVFCLPYIPTFSPA